MVKIETAKGKKKNEISFSLKSIDLLDVSIQRPIKVLADNTIFNFNINIEHQIDIENKSLFVITSIAVHEQNIKNIKLGTISTNCIFSISNLNDFVINAKVNIPVELNNVFNTIAISTTRGIMYSQFKGTYLHNALLPAIDPKALKTVRGNKQVYQ